MFNIFKKKTAKTETPEVETILSIPIKIKDDENLSTLILLNNLNEYIFAGRILMHLQTKESFQLEVNDRIEHLKEVFKWAGLVNQLSEGFLNEVDSHNHVIYLKFKTGNTDKLKSIALAANAILKAGGIGVHVETTGKSFSKEQWTELSSKADIYSIYHMFVLDSIQDESGGIYSCGMHNLGYPDTMVTGEKFHDAVNLIRSFSSYLLHENPSIMENQTFSSEQDAPIFKISKPKEQPSKGLELFENPFGFWQLTRKKE